MKKILFVLAAAAATLCALAANDDFTLVGRVRDNQTKTDLTNARVLLYDSAGNVRDTLRANKGMTYRAGVVDTLAEFVMQVPRADSTIIFDVMCEGYKTQTVAYSLSKVGRREKYRYIPTVYMARAPHTLKDVTVTATKIKFAHKGDTIVYNADAFQLAEGSMLDALIAQLPGVELNNDGQIKVNGQFVESLLLNGKEFLDGNNNLMLENIGAYTVKNIEVYEGISRKAKLKGDEAAPKQLTMDVKLKKEYNMGWIINAQGGYGTDDRYMAKLFASWFNSTTRLTFVGNANNLNDNRTPGRMDTWTPEMMPNGKKEHRMAGFNYNHENTEGTLSANGSLRFQQTVNNVLTTTSRTNFLPGGDTYDYSYGSSHNRETSVYTNHSLFRTVKEGAVNYGGDLYGNYNHSKNTGSSLSGTFNEEQPEMTAEILEAIYSDGSEERLGAIVNRSRTRSDGWSRILAGGFSPYFGFKIPRTSDRLSFDASVDYQSAKEELWRDYQVNYGRDAASAVHRRYYTDNSPNHTFSFMGATSYTMRPGDFYLSLGYSYRFVDRTKDSYMYALDRLADMGVYGTVPAGYLAAFDPANSFTSHTFENRHTINPMMMYNKTTKDGFLTIRLQPRVELTHRKFSYFRDGKHYPLSTSNATVAINSIWTGMVEYQFGKIGEGQRSRYRNSLRYSYRIEPRLPELEDMVDVVNDADPLNIYLGNPNLKAQIRHNHLARWSYSPASHTFTNILYLGYIHTSGELLRGYTYDTATGVRYNRMYNVDGNNRAAITNELNWQFGSIKQFTLSSETDAALSHSSDMVGVNMQEPERTRVKNVMLNQKIRLAWNIGKQTISLRGDFTNRHTTSTQPDFNTLNANHFNYGVSGTFRLPAGFSINTDFTCYTRRGYGSEHLDTTDPVWNARLSYCPPRNSRWVFMVDGFDLLHKLSNVNYAVTATGRTVSYTNALPRYVLFSVQYRLNIQPKKR